ncbi:MAG: SPOR domain-containing protein [Rhodovibrionaceae bacterium]
MFVLTPAVILPVTAQAQDYAAGLDAYDRGEFEEALRILQPLADAGDARAQYGIGKIYETGGGPIVSDPQQAVLWYSRSAEQGVAAAQNNLALMYAEGRGVSQNKPQALALWEAAARGGHPHAQYNMGLLFYRGEGVERDLSMAAAWFGQAAESGLAEAQFAVAEMHRLGIGLPQDDRKALGWYQLAAAQGHEAARSQTGRLRGLGIAPEDVQGSFSMPPGRADQVQLTAATTEQTPSAPQVALPEPRPEPQPVQETPISAAPEVAATPASAPEPEPNTDSIPEAQAQAAAAAASPAAALPSRQLASTSAAVPASGGAFSLWLGSMNEEGAAREMSASLTSLYGESLSGADLTVRRVEVGGSDVFYRVVASSWPSIADARSVCSALRHNDPAVFCKVVQD